MDENYAADQGVFNAGAEFQRRERKDLGSVTEAARDIPSLPTPTSWSSAAVPQGQRRRSRRLGSART